VTVDDAFVLELFQIIEQLSDDVDDPYHYHIIRVLVSCNWILHATKMLLKHQ
jgi:hypothetical protein